MLKAALHAVALFNDLGKLRVVAAVFLALIVVAALIAIAYTIKTVVKER